MIIIINNTSICKSSIAFKKFKFRGATNRIMWLVIYGDRQKLSLEHGTAEHLWWKSNFKQICFLFFMKGVYNFRRFNRNMELVPNCWHSSEKARLPIFSLVLGTKSYLEAVDLRVLEISEKCSRLTK